MLTCLFGACNGSKAILVDLKVSKNIVVSAKKVKIKNGIEFRDKDATLTLY